MDAASSVLHQNRQNTSVDSTLRSISNDPIAMNNHFHDISQVPQSNSSVEGSLSISTKPSSSNSFLANNHEATKLVNGFPSVALPQQNDLPKSTVEPLTESPDIQPTVLPSPTTPSKTSADRLPSAIPRLLPSAIPRLQTQLSVPGMMNTNNGIFSYVVGTPVGSVQTSAYSRYESQARPFNSTSHPTGSMDFGNGRSRATSRLSSAIRLDRSTSEHPQRPADVESDTSSVFSSSGAPRKISSKINSLMNVQHKPGGGNVTIVDEKLKLGPISSKCNSLANVKHKPGGGNVQIMDVKIDTSAVQPRVNSLQNVKHVPAGGHVQIVQRSGIQPEYACTPAFMPQSEYSPKCQIVKIISEKLEFDKKAKPKVGSLKNASHQPGGGSVQIYNETLPWLKYNKPNLPPEEKARINKHRSTSHGDMTCSMHSGSTALTSDSGTGL